MDYKQLNGVSRGFIQIPILIAIFILGAVATSAGYYVVKENAKASDQYSNVISDEIETSTTTKLSFADKIRPATSSLKLSDVSGVKWDGDTAAGDTQVNNAQYYISQLSTIKEAVDELNTAESEVKTKIIKTETDISDLRIEKLKTLTHSSDLEVINKTYEELIAIEELRKSNIKLVLGSSLMDSLFYSMEVGSALESLKKVETKEGISTAQKLVDTYSIRIEGLKDQSSKAIETAIAENKAYAQEFLLRLDSTMAIANRYSELTQMLGEIQLARKDLENALTVTANNSYYVQPAQVVVQTQSITSETSCKFPTSKYVLIPSRGWVSVKQCQNGTYVEASKYTPDTSTMTQKQICDMRKAAQFSGGAYISDSQPDPACK